MSIRELSCATCGETKPVTHFHQRGRSRTGYAPTCRECVNRKRRGRKTSPASANTQLRTLIKKGDLEGVRTQLGGQSFDAQMLLNVCVTPYGSFPKKDTHPELADYLIRQGANPRARGTQGEPLIALATKTGRMDLVQTLIDAGAVVDIFSAAALLDVAAVKQFLEKNPSLAKANDDNGLTGLHYCAGSALGRSTVGYHKSQIDTVRLLLEAGSDPNVEADTGILVTPLVACCQSGGNPEVVQLLVQGGADPNHPHALRSALRHFKQKRTSENPIADALVDAGCQVDTLIDSERTCLHAYSHHEEIQAVAWLLEHGASVAARTLDGRAPLHLAADRNNHTSVVKRLIEYGADIRATDASGNKPIDYARGNDKARIVAFLEDCENQQTS